MSTLNLVGAYVSDLVIRGYSCVGSISGTFAAHVEPSILPIFICMLLQYCTHSPTLTPTLTLKIRSYDLQVAAITVTYFQALFCVTKMGLPKGTVAHFHQLRQTQQLPTSLSFLSVLLTSSYHQVPYLTSTS